MASARSRTSRSEQGQYIRGNRCRQCYQRLAPSWREALCRDMNLLRSARLPKHKLSCKHAPKRPRTALLRAGYASASLASTASPSASTLRAACTCSSSTRQPSSTTSAEPPAAAASKAATTRRLCSSWAAEGAKARLAAARVFGWMSVLPSKPRARPCAWLGRGVCVGRACVGRVRVAWGGCGVGGGCVGVVEVDGVRGEEGGLAPL